MKKTSSLFMITLGLLSIGLTVGSVAASNSKLSIPTFATYSNHDSETYYKSIDNKLSGDDLLKALNTLNSGKRKSTVGYNAMGTSPSGQFKYTDYDPNNVKYDDNNQPYGTKILSFYSGASTTSWNREHVWPKSKGGNLIEADIHVIRPTIASENSNRGNSFYVEGMSHSSDGWDPIIAFGENGVYEGIRGECARIIFYSAIADTRLTIVDKNTDTNSNNTMGKLSDLIKWHLTDPVNQREKNRNEGAEYLQGNRNPFIDHPEYVCTIWGNKNDDTRKICNEYEIKPTSISLNTKQITLGVDETYNLTYTVSPLDALYSVNWEVADENIVSLNNGVIKALKPGKTAVAVYIENMMLYDKCEITVIGKGENKNSSSGCGGNIVTTSTILSTLCLLGIGIILVRKYRYEKE